MRAQAEGPTLAEQAGSGHPGTAMSLAPAALDRSADGGTPEVILIATGSEVPIALAARALLAASQVTARVVSMPCLEWFAEQDEGDAGVSVGLDHFGASADDQKLSAEFGVTAQRAAQAALTSLAAAAGRPVRS